MTDTIVNLIEALDGLIQERNQLRRRVEELEFLAKNENKPKLTTREVEHIHELARAGHTQTDIASMFDVNRATVSRIVRGLYHK